MDCEEIDRTPFSTERNTRAFRARIAIFILMLVIAVSAAIRIHHNFTLSTFNFEHPEGQFMSDPALLFYLTQRIVDHNGHPPRDFRCDRRIAYPESSDLPAMFTIGQEFYLAWGYRLFGKQLPLHVYCAIAMSLFACLAVIGVFGLARELTGRMMWAAFAAIVYGLTPANYRSIGFILIREDFSLPFYAIHLWLTIRALRTGTPSAYILAALPLIAALSTWHAMVFIMTLEMTAVFVWYLRTGHNPLSKPHAWMFPLLLATASLTVPVLRAKLFIISLPMQLLYVLLALSLVERRYHLHLPLRLVTGMALFAGAIVFSFYSAIDFDHVFEFIWNTLIHLGRMPVDPNGIPFGARLLWQGPFVSEAPADLLGNLGLSGLMLLAALVQEIKYWRRGRGSDAERIVLLFAALTLAASILIKRLVVLPGMVAPAITTLVLSRLPWKKAQWLGGTIILVFQSLLLVSLLMSMKGSTWYPPFESRHLKHFLGWVQTNLDGQSAIATDFVNSAAILAHTGHPVILQPKYETRSSRDRIERYLKTFYFGSPDDLRNLLRDLNCRYLLVDAYIMIGLRYQAGLPWSARPLPGTAAEAFLSSNPDVYGAIPGFRLIYISAEQHPTWRFYQIE